MLGMSLSYDLMTSGPALLVLAQALFIVGGAVYLKSSKRGEESGLKLDAAGMIRLSSNAVLTLAVMLPVLAIVKKRNEKLAWLLAGLNLVRYAVVGLEMKILKSLGLVEGMTAGWLKQEEEGEWKQEEEGEWKQEEKGLLKQEEEQEEGEEEREEEGEEEEEEKY